MPIMSVIIVRGFQFVYHRIWSFMYSAKAQFNICAACLVPLCASQHNIRDLPVRSANRVAAFTAAAVTTTAAAKARIRQKSEGKFAL
jgi:hypothetical protein